MLEELSIEYIGFQRQIPYLQDSPLKISYYLDYLKQRKEEINAWRRVQVCTTVSRHDARYINEYSPLTQVHLVPNGIDTDVFRSINDESLEPTILFVGNYRYYPNADAASVLAQRIFPIVKRHIAIAKLILAGADPTENVKVLSGIIGVEVPGYVSNYQSLLGSAWVFAAPIRSGGGTRIKILEAFSMCKAVVTTSIGCEGIEANHLHDVIIEDDFERFALWIVELLQNKSRRHLIGENARKVVIRKYRWSHSAYQLLTSYQNAIEIAEHSK